MHNKSTQTDQQLDNLRLSRSTVALLTQHGKEKVIAPVLAELLGCRVEKVEGFDTDLLGTFTRDIAREGSQLDAARKKARIGMELSGLSIGLASEGSFGTDPFTGMLPWNRELLIWIDDRLGIEVIANSAGKTNFSHRLVESWEEAAGFRPIGRISRTPPGGPSGGRKSPRTPQRLGRLAQLRGCGNLGIEFRAEPACFRRDRHARVRQSDTPGKHPAGRRRSGSAPHFALSGVRCAWICSWRDRCGDSPARTAAPQPTR